MRITALITVVAAAAQAGDFQRDLSPDRPDTTESPFTVEPGRIQVESSIWAYARDRSDGVESQTWTFGEANVKFGIADNHDVQIVLRPYIRESLRGAAESDAEGFGDIDLRWKWNLWGNDGGATAAALMPFVTIPTHTAVSTGEWEGGLIFTFASDLGGGWGFGAQVEIDRVWDGDSGRHEWDFLHSVVIGRDLGESFGVYLEYFGVSGGHPYEANLSGGFTWALGPDVQLDLGAVAGLNDAAEDFSIFQGMTFRF